MPSDTPSSPDQTPSSSDAEDYPVWKRWGDIDEHSKPSPSGKKNSKPDGEDPAWARLKAQLRKAENGRAQQQPTTPPVESEFATAEVGFDQRAVANHEGDGGAVSLVEPPTEEADDARAAHQDDDAEPADAGSHGDVDARVDEDPPARDFRSWEADFSALDIRDRVVIMLLFKQVVQIDEVEAAWRRFQNTNQGRSREPLWRILARDSAFDRNRILEEAAKSAGFEKATINPSSAAAFIDANFPSFSESDWERMLTLNVVPIAKEEDPRSGRRRYVFVSPDPTRPGISNLLRDLKLGGHVLRFAPEHVIDGLLADLTGRGSANSRGAQIEEAPRTKNEEMPRPSDDEAPRPSNDARAESASPEPPPSFDRAEEASHIGELQAEEAEKASETPASQDAAEPNELDHGAGHGASDEESAAELEAAPIAKATTETAPDETRVHVAVDQDPAPTQAASEASPEARELLEGFLTAAVEQQASGVHLLPVDEGLQIDMRIDGELERWQTCSRSLGDELLAAIKEEALNIKPSEIDSVQDGTIRREVHGTTVRFRVSILPIAGGFSEDRRESIVITMLGDDTSASTLESLGLPDETLEHLRAAIAEPRGMVVLAGPSGSGRGTTLSAILNEIVTPKVNVITLEESVAHEAQGVRQVRLNNKLDHEDALEAVRRHDPDIILAGELRTKETAELALNLANAGHLVFSRLPAHDTTGVVSRLFRLGVDPFLIAYAINLVVAQRLMRRLCADCKQPAKHIDGELLRRLGFSRQEIASTKFFDEGAAECPTCEGRRYHGTQIIAEAMPFTHDTRRLIALADASLDEEDVRMHAVREGMITIRSSAREVVLRGETSVEELIRVTAGGH